MVGNREWDHEDSLDWVKSEPRDWVQSGLGRIVNKKLKIVVAVNAAMRRNLWVEFAIIEINGKTSLRLDNYKNVVKKDD